MLGFFVVLLCLPLLFVAGYLLLLTLLSGKAVAPSPGSGKRFVIIVPAHNESSGIGRTVQSLLSMDYAAEHRRVLVVADNCSDDTAALARAAGAAVLERQSDTERGKGYALKLAYETVLAEGWADAVVVVDADTAVTPNLLAAFAARLSDGAGAAQVFYGVLNPLAAWRTRLMTIALAIFHRLRGRGRERLGASAGLRGNGMCFTLGTLRAVPHRAFSIVEDLEYAIALGKAGIRVHYVDEAEALGEMVSSEKAARSQRERWEGGRQQMLREHGWPLLREAVARRDGLLFDLALDVVIPPLAYLGLAALVSAVVGGLLASLGWIGSFAGWVLAFPLIALLVHVARGIVLSGLGLKAWLDVTRAPAYLAWKILLLLRRKTGANWVRTEREADRK